MLADDRPGNVNQALGVAEALGWPFERREIRYGPLARLPNALLGASTLGLTAESRAALRPPWPDVVIAAGRRSAPVARWLKRRRASAGDGGFLVQLMWPGSAPPDLDLIAVPEHDDPPRRPNVLATLGAPHRVTPERLTAAADALAPRLAALPRPRIALLVGGASRHAPFTEADAAELGRRAAALARAAGGSLLVTTSRRTGAAAEAALLAAIDGVPAFVHRWRPDGGDNPYFGLLGACDAAIVTADSASMVSEACAAGRPVYLFTPAAGAAPKHARMQGRLAALGYLRPLAAGDGGGGESFTAEGGRPPLNPAAAVAEAVREWLAKKPA